LETPSVATLLLLPTLVLSTLKVDVSIEIGAATTLVFLMLAKKISLSFRKLK